MSGPCVFLLLFPVAVKIKLKILLLFIDYAPICTEQAKKQTYDNSFCVCCTDRNPLVAG